MRGDWDINWDSTGAKLIPHPVTSGEDSLQMTWGNSGSYKDDSGHFGIAGCDSFEERVMEISHKAWVMFFRYDCPLEDVTQVMEELGVAEALRHR